MSELPDEQAITRNSWTVLRNTDPAHVHVKPTPTRLMAPVFLAICSIRRSTLTRLIKSRLRLAPGGILHKA